MSDCKELAGSDHDLLKVELRHLLEGTEKNNFLSIASVSTEILSGYKTDAIYKHTAPSDLLHTYSRLV
jgi:hypothetical protein